MRRSSSSNAVLITAFAIVVHYSAQVSSAAKPTTQPPASQQTQAAEQLVKAALIAEAGGDAKRRADDLKQALDAVPDLAAAHWHSGHVQREGHWLAVEDAERETVADGKMAEYRKLRDAVAAPTYDDHIRLARWAGKAGLKEQERAHYIFALQLQNDSAEAISKLGLIHFQGELIEKSEYESYRRRLKQSTENAAMWNSRLNKLRVQFDKRPGERQDVLSEVRSLQEAAAIQSMEQILLTGKMELALAAVEALAEFNHQKTTESLARVAVFSKDTVVQAAAAKALIYRPRHTYLPLLLAGLQMPMYGEYMHMSLDGNRTLSRIIMCQEGPAENRVAINDHEHTLTASSFTLSPPALARTRGNLITRIESTKQRAFEQKLNATNAKIVQLNERICSVLTTVTDQKVDDDPRLWWDWWYSENEYYRPVETPTNIVESKTYGSSHMRVSCFVRGTPVWTTTGPMPIEKIKPGESVLAQNPETGELTYKPVLATTNRPLSPVLEIRSADTVIRSTRGHPFWISGIGWQMAKELNAGQYLHTVDGPQKIDSIEPTEEDVCYNLIVADFHNYFISDAKVLVHDNTLRGPLVARVPGLVE